MKVNSSCGSANTIYHKGLANHNGFLFNNVTHVLGKGLVHKEKHAGLNFLPSGK
jgi:hypothetical protein